MCPNKAEDRQFRPTESGPSGQSSVVPTIIIVEIDPTAGSTLQLLYNQRDEGIPIEVPIFVGLFKPLHDRILLSSAGFLGNG